MARVQRAAVALLLSLRLLLAAAHAHRDRYPYSELLSEAVSYCYSRLAKHPGCCIDKHFAADVQRHTVRRSGTEWHCGKDCYDSVDGLRGDDVIWTPKGATCESPRVMFIHGGSWQFGSPDTLGYAQLGSKLASMFGAIVMMIDYPLNPVGNYSTIMEFALSSLRWLEGHGPHASACSSTAPLFVGGDSSGGGTALSLVLELSRRRKLQERSPILAGAFFWSPWTNLRCNTPEYYFNAFATINDKRAGLSYVGDIMFQGRPDQNLGWFTANAQSYVGNNESLLTDPIASPFYANRQDLAGSPPLYFAVGGSESILGDSVVVAQKAAIEGVDVHLDIHSGMWHVFPMYSEGCGGGHELTQAAKAFNMTVKFLRHVAQTGRPPYRVLLDPSPLEAVATGQSTGKLPYTVVNYDPTDKALILEEGDDWRQHVETLYVEGSGAEQLDLATVSADGEHVNAAAAGCLGTLAIQATIWSIAACWQRRYPAGSELSGLRLPLLRA